MPALLQAPAKAPLFTLSNQDNQPVALSDLLHKGPVVVFFYPKDESTICTKEACAFRDSFSVFQDMGASVVGISGDSVASHRKFADKHGFSFLLLSDADNAVRKAYGVANTLFVLPGRATFVIGQDGHIKLSFSAALAAQHHVDQALQALRA